MEHIKADEQEKALINNPKYIGAVELVILRNFYYRDSFHKLMGICLLLLAILIALLFALRYEIKNIPEPKYFATTYDGTPLPRIPLSQANMEPNNLITWATEATQSAYSLNFLNYRVALQNARGNFTRQGYEQFLLAFKKSNNIEAIQKKKFVVYTKIIGTPKITKSSSTDPEITREGAYTWQLEFPMAIIYENSNPQETIIQQNNVILIVRRLSTLEATAGVGIDSMVLTPLGG